MVYYLNRVFSITLGTLMPFIFLGAIVMALSAALMAILPGVAQDFADTGFFPVIRVFELVSPLVALGLSFFVIVLILAWQD